MTQVDPQTHYEFRSPGYREGKRMLNTSTRYKQDKKFKTLCELELTLSLVSGQRIGSLKVV